MVAWWLVLLLAPNIVSGNWYSLYQIRTGKEHVPLTKGFLLHVAERCTGLLECVIVSSRFSERYQFGVFNPENSSCQIYGGSDSTDDGRGNSVAANNVTKQADGQLVLFFNHLIHSASSSVTETTTSTTETTTSTAETTTSTAETTTSTTETTTSTTETTTSTAETTTSTAETTTSTTETTTSTAETITSTTETATSTTETTTSTTELVTTPDENYEPERCEAKECDYTCDDIDRCVCFPKQNLIYPLGYSCFDSCPYCSMDSLDGKRFATVTAGWVQSEGYPYYYSPYSDFIFHIEWQFEDHWTSIRISFYHFIVESCNEEADLKWGRLEINNCPYDYLRIEDTKYCGIIKSDLPYSVETKIVDFSARIRFHSDMDCQGKFLFHFQLV
ncbi:hypothetical protein EB796_021318 [Bugula neritina]|uniref:CUB domain-containing protein n=1 Tax=Bugula neritina TaxID=10212 RepID=A0A7J7J3W7_BUGNE|nr:hypothetical protein EB796_021318 [Bugula neritina]